MTEFVLLFRRPTEHSCNLDQPEDPAFVKKFETWFEAIAADGRLIDLSLGLQMPAKVLKPSGVVTDGPFVEIRERLAGLIVIKADSLDEAVTLAHGCPILDIDGSVEVRPFRHVPVPGALAYPEKH